MMHLKFQDEDHKEKERLFQEQYPDAYERIRDRVWDRQRDRDGSDRNPWARTDLENDKNERDIMRKNMLVNLHDVALAEKFDISHPKTKRQKMISKMANAIASYGHDDLLMQHMKRPWKPHEMKERREYKESVERIMYHIARAVRIRHRRSFDGPDGELWVGDNYSPEKALAKWVPRFNEKVIDLTGIPREKLKEFQKKDVVFDIDDPQGFFYPHPLWGESRFVRAYFPTGDRDRQKSRYGLY
jgi:hypothetical protein